MLATKIITAIIPAMGEIVEKINKERDKFCLGEPSKPKIQGFSTPQPNIFAVSFAINFELQDTRPERSDAALTVEGTCSYNSQNQEEVSEIEIVSWAANLKGSVQGWQSRAWQSTERLERMYSNMRLIE